MSSPRLGRHDSTALEPGAAPRVAFHLVPRELTIGDLRRVYEILEGTTYDKANFRRRFLRLVEEGKLEPIEGQQATGGRPAAVYRLVEGRG